MKIIINKKQLGLLFEYEKVNSNILNNIPINSWIRTQKEEFQVLKDEGDYIVGKSFCDENRILKIWKKDIISVTDKENNKKSQIKNLSKLNFEKYLNNIDIQETIDKENKQKIILFLDDNRNPYQSKKNWIKDFSPIGIDNINVIHVETMEQFTNYILTHGLPDAIIFDNDLGKKDKTDRSGCDCSVWLVNYCLKNKLKLPKWSIISANKYGRCCINTILRKYETL